MDELVHGHQLDGGDAEAVRCSTTPGGRGRRRCRAAPRARRGALREPLDVGLVDDRLVHRVAAGGRCPSRRTGRDDDACGTWARCRRRCSGRRGRRSRRRSTPGPSRPRRRSPWRTGRAAAWRVAPQALGRAPTARGPGSRSAGRADVGQVGVPAVAVDLGQLDPLLAARRRRSPSPSRHSSLIARSARLRYLPDDRPGSPAVVVSRASASPGRGGRVGAEDRERIRSLVIPPAWRGGWGRRADAHLQATGVDDAGRKQYLYHPRWREVADVEKFRRLADFAPALVGVAQAGRRRPAALRSRKGATATCSAPRRPASSTGPDPPRRPPPERIGCERGDGPRRAPRSPSRGQRSSSASSASRASTSTSRSRTGCWRECCPNSSTGPGDGTPLFCSGGELVDERGSNAYIAECIALGLHREGLPDLSDGDGRRRARPPPTRASSIEV